MRRRREYQNDSGLPEPQLVMMSVVSAVLALFIILCSKGKSSDTRLGPIFEGLHRAFPKMLTQPASEETRKGLEAERSALPPDLLTFGTPTPKKTEYLFLVEALFPRNELSLNARAAENLRLLVARHSNDSEISLTLSPDSDELIDSHKKLALLDAALRQFHPGSIHPLLQFGSKAGDAGRIVVTVYESKEGR